MLVVIALAATILPGVFSPGDDWRVFDHQRVRVVRVLDGQTFLARRTDSEQDTRIALVGAAAPQGAEHWSLESSRALATRIAGKDVILRLEATQTRTPDGALLAYVYPDEITNLNLELVREGSVYSEQRWPHSLHHQFDQAESEARKKSRGLWRGLSDSQMPAWRQQWFAHQRELKNQSR